MSRALVPYSSYNTEVDTKFYSSYYVDEPKLIKRCFEPIDSFRDLGEVTTTEDGIYIFIDNNAPILAVAHLDTVISDKTWTRTSSKLYIPQLDDRLGVHCLLDILPKHGLVYDILLTEGEETGNSTAKHFKMNKQYNWMFEIDRSGNDAVMYQYETSKYRDLLKQSGFKIGLGSFTDISYLSHLQCLGINFGCAYYNNHSVDAWLDLEELDDQLDKIIPFIRDNYNTHHKWDYSMSESKWYGAWDDDYTYSSYRYTTYTSYRTGYKTCPYCTASNFLSETVCYSCGLALTDDSKCLLCNSQHCYGMEMCELCGFEFHNCDFVHNFDFCEDCLKTLGLSWDLLNKYQQSVVLEDIERYSEQIRNFIE